VGHHNVGFVQAVNEFTFFLRISEKKITKLSIFFTSDRHFFTALTRDYPSTSFKISGFPGALLGIALKKSAVTPFPNIEEMDSTFDLVLQTCRDF
jgi:hypothetical protein